MLGEMATSKKQQGEQEGVERMNEALTKTESFIERYRYWILGAVGAVVLVVVCVVLYKSYIVAPREQEAQEQIFHAQQQFQQDSLAVALNGDGNNLGFLQVIKEYSGTKAGNMARYYAGMIYREQGEWDAALEMLSDFKKKDQMLAPIAYGAMGDCYVEKDDLASGVKYYKKAIGYVENGLTAPIFLMKLAAVQGRQGNWQAAMSSYEKIKTGYPSSAEARDIDKYIAYAQQKAAK